MRQLQKKQQGGAVLLVALIMLLVLTVLTVTNMREVTLEGRMTANKMENQQLFNASESALREAENRFYGRGQRPRKLEPNTENCKKINTYKRLGNKPCIIEVASQDPKEAYAAAINDFLRDPLIFIKEQHNWTGAETTAASNSTYIPWMPYRGTSAGTITTLSVNAFWNSVEIPVEGINVEYGDAGAGKGTYYYLITGQANDQFAVQSTIARFHSGE
ncbi:MAG: PilX N-terminal domain-containing pilus assembly protein [Pseudomonas sp.]|uniref:pilus assembly PilX family protein n=1 Tax=Pseudomonas sp. TaxID=306 RepID=UPI002735D62E|nr:PilX N-terminal domain-containing pilus assembly protein [Pseudomonas sp.]MDP3846282.1 PilX N-terminal domain-containing pilus assembly protein [Pseudomonas sp.]